MNRAFMSNVKGLLYYITVAAFITMIGVSMNGCAQAVMGAMAAAKAAEEQRKEDAKKKPEMTQLQIRKMQTREWDVMDKNKIMSVALAVLQDDGFVVANANVDVGLLAAHKDLFKKDVDDTGTAFAKGFFGLGYSVSESTYSRIEASLTVTPFGQKTRVRMSARLAETSTAGFNADVTRQAITEAKFYQEFFTKLEKGLFIEREKL